MDEPNTENIKPLENTDDPLEIHQGDAPSTRKQKQFLSQLRWEQKVSLTAFVLMVLMLPITLLGIYGPTHLVPQAKRPDTPISPNFPTPTQTPTPYFLPGNEVHPAP